MDLFGLSPRKLVEAATHRAGGAIQHAQRVGRKVLNLGSDQEFGKMLPHREAVGHILGDLALSKIEGRDPSDAVKAFRREAQRLEEIGVDIGDILEEGQKAIIAPYLAADKLPPHQEDRL